MLMRFDPFRDLDRLAQQFGAARVPVVPMDAVRDGHRLVARFDLPGVDPAALEVTIERNVLTVAGERTGVAGHEGSDGPEVLAAERPAGRFRRQIFLGEELDAERAAARYEHGVLTVEIPVREDAHARRVPVAAGSEAPAAIGAAAGAD